jgi:diguanylate cyclase (GGDEF)-like protein
MNSATPPVFFPPRNRLLQRLLETGREMPPSIRAIMLLSLFGSANLALTGMVCVMLFDLMMETLLHNVWSASVLGANVVLSLARLVVMRRIAQAQAAGQPTPTDAYMGSLSAWCLCQGLGAMLAIASNISALQTVGFIIVVAVIGSISVRQYAGGAFALLLTCLTTLPIMAGVAFANNHWLWVLLLLIPVFIYSNFTMVLDLQRVTSESLIAQHESHQMARHDSLTGALNRFGLMETLATLRGAAANEFTIFCFDLDGFKQVNDTRGHMAGDVLLKSVVQRLRAVVRSEDFVARLGGDEFLVLAPKMGAVQAAEFAIQLRSAITDAPHEMESGPNLSIGVSIGFACAPVHGTAFPALYHHADAALYTAKQANREAQRVFTPAATA